MYVHDGPESVALTGFIRPRVARGRRAGGFGDRTKGSLHKPSPARMHLRHVNRGWYS